MSSTSGLWQSGRPVRSIVRSGAVAALALACSAAALADDFIGSVLAGGLHNPRGLSFGPDGGLYIAEAGVPTGSGPSTLVRGQAQIYVETGSITRYADGAQTRVLTNLPTLYNAVTGEVGAGPNDIIFSASGAPLIAIGAGIDPNVRATDLAPAGSLLGRVITLGASYDVAGHEAAYNPAGGPLDSNPWHLASSAAGTLVTDAGGNSLLLIGGNGVISTVATFASQVNGPFTSDAVPTGLAVGADGAYYVGQLTGFPFVPGSAQVMRVLPSGEMTTFASGFTQITDLAFGADGSLYVLEYDSNGLTTPGDGGALWKVAVDGSKTLVFTGSLAHPTGLEIAADGSFYVSNHGDSASAGELLHITAVPEPQTAALLLAGLALVAGVACRRRQAGARCRADS